MTRYYRLILGLAAAAVLAGCGREGDRSAAEFGLRDDEAPAIDAPIDSSLSMTRAPIGGEAEGGGVSNAALNRRIIYTATLDMVVDDFDAVSKRIRAEVQKAGGFLDEANDDRTYGDAVNGHFVVRVPVKEFEGFLEKVRGLGLVEKNNVNAQDVTEEFYDLEARLKNQQAIEERILKLLDDRTAELEDVITVETKLGQVREQIERIEGRLRYLTEQAAMTTVTIHVREEKNYTPPQAPTFGDQIGGTFLGSLEGMLLLGKGLVLAAVGAGPWLLLACLIALPFLIWWRVRRGHARRAIVDAQ